MANIRVGMIGGDLHALYYGAQMFEYDPIAIRAHGRAHGALFYHYTHYNDPAVMTVPYVGGFELAKAWDTTPEDAEAVVACFGGEVCAEPEGCSDDVDLVFIPECNGDGSTHLELATPGLEKGVPTFVDKPLAYTLADAKAILQLGKEHDVAVMSLSMLRMVPDGARFRDRLQELGPRVGYGSIKGGGTAMAGHIHAISLAQAIFGDGVAAVEAMGPDELSYVHLDYGGREDRPEAGVMLNCDSGPTYHCSFYVSAFGEAGAIHSGQIGDFEFPFGSALILDRIKTMVETGEPQADHDQMIECIAITEAGRLAQQEGRRVSLDEVVEA